MKKLFALSLLVVLLLSACGGGSATEVVPAGEEPAAEGKAVVRMWAHTNNAFIAGYEALIAACEAEHPDVA